MVVGPGTLDVEGQLEGAWDHGILVSQRVLESILWRLRSKCTFIHGFLPFGSCQDNPQTPAVQYGNSPAEGEGRCYVTCVSGAGDTGGQDQRRAGQRCQSLLLHQEEKGTEGAGEERRRDLHPTSDLFLSTRFYFVVFSDPYVKYSTCLHPR